MNPELPAMLEDALSRGFAALVLTNAMKPMADVPEITDACWGILGKSPKNVMCATSRMVVKREGATVPAVIACT